MNKNRISTEIAEFRKSSGGGRYAYGLGYEEKDIHDIEKTKRKNK